MICDILAEVCSFHFFIVIEKIYILFSKISLGNSRCCKLVTMDFHYILFASRLLSLPFNY